MFEPNGPLPPEIYWRRRVLAIVVAVVVLALVIWAVLAFTGGDDPETEPAASGTTMSETTATTPDGSGVEAGAETGSDDSGSDTAGSGSSNSSNASSGSSTPSGGAESDEADPDAPTTPVSASTAPGQCSDQSLAVRVTAGEPNYQVGAEPEFTIVITNIGTSSCERDLGAGLQQVLVYTLDGNQRVWANTDCFPDSTADVRSLRPGDQAAFSVRWSGTTSEPGCATPREPVQPGAYTVVGQLGGLRSTPEPFNMTA
ncbi:hypothetical protein HCA61_10075 [Rhodococcus sp. HNM0563]|uniref:hypothetical protein n=1 Tax=Rhodococcus sp. HNM0563 TaxID=2716339 RepID=UPI00146BDEB8|nr:hypothetical protein [Rhodococcus sp. HNM0563]